MLKQVTRFAQCCRRQRALDAPHFSYDLVTWQTEHSRGGNENNPEPDDGGTPLALPWDGHGEADCARDFVRRAQERDDSVRAYRREHDVICVHEGRVHARIIRDKVQLASTKEPKPQDILRDEGELVVVREAVVAGQQEGGESGEPVRRRHKAEVREVVRDVIGDDAHFVIGEVRRVVEEGKVMGKVTRGRFLF
eukprot:4262478-Pleurochrysis_carterae.AAC.5